MFGNSKGQNLIANGSFENTINNYDCSGSYANYQISAPVFGAPFIDSWLGVQSPDYFNTSCFSPSPYQYGYGTPANGAGEIYPKTGIAYSGFIVFAIQGEYKEFVFQHLSSPLISGKSYCLSFYVSRADRNQYAIKNIGAYLSATIPSSNSPTTNYFNFIPQVENQSGFITDTTQWTQIQGCFTANGGEQYITIGNFNYNVNTDTLYVGTNNPDPNYANPLYDYSYYYIDDVSLYEQTSVGMHYLDDDVFYIYPNPTKDLLKIDVGRFKNNNEDYTIKIVDIFGKEIFNEILKEEIDVSKLDQGIYSLQLYEDGKLIGTKKILKE
jgi:hypothetical protein